MTKIYPDFNTKPNPMPASRKGSPMPTDVTIVIGGKAGQGILTVGELITSACLASGFHIFANNEFESRIRGGHSFSQIRISDHPVNAPDDRIHLLVALDAGTVSIHRNRLASDALILIDDNKTPETGNPISIALEDLALAAGDKITANTVASAACLGLLGAPETVFDAVIAKQFSQKTDEVLNRNRTAARLGFEAVKNHRFKWAITWNADPPKGILIDGAKAVALGALAADCRVAAFYPMSPATGILVHLSDLSDVFPLVVEQAEDEIAAVNMAIGASFAGVRAMTATSGGGFCLMTEGLGLAGITETPLVIVNAQRPGPATGLATRTAQGDLLFCIRAAQDEFPRFVFAPATPFEAYQITVRAFDLADKYQAPAIVLIDKFLADSLFTTPRLQAPEILVHHTFSDKDTPSSEPYRRYAFTESGVSPRALPCMGKGLVKVSGNEHREDGHTSEDAALRTRMVDKRNTKFAAMAREMQGPKVFHGNAAVLLVGWGSTQGALTEAMDRLRGAGMDVGAVVFSDLWPFPADACRNAIGRAKQFFMVEQNRSAQLGALIREQTGLAYSGAILKYDGRPFHPGEIVNRVLGSG
jgi:2-oxoglutarate/2-oxoacid ferredoxin oxidoreductase subunit alpha